MRSAGSRRSRVVARQVMSLARYSKRRDANEKPIIDGIRATGKYAVFQLDRPCDLAVYAYETKRWRMLEVKPKKNPRWQPGQEQLCRNHGIPVVTDLDEAIAALESA